MAAEFVSHFSKDIDRRALPAIALTTDTSFLIAFGNDCGFEGTFERQVEALGNPEDVLIGISTSGNSPNVIRAIEAARKGNIGTIALTVNSGRLAGLGGCSDRLCRAVILNTFKKLIWPLNIYCASWSSPFSS